MAELAAIGEHAPRTAKAIGGALPVDIAPLASARPAGVHLTLTLKIILRFRACSIKACVLFRGLNCGATDSPKRMLG